MKFGTVKNRGHTEIFYLNNFLMKLLNVVMVRGFEAMLEQR
jgi:hypothetical protein